MGCHGACCGGSATRWAAAWRLHGRPIAPNGPSALHAAALLSFEHKFVWSLARTTHSCIRMCAAWADPVAAGCLRSHLCMCAWHAGVLPVSAVCSACADARLEEQLLVCTPASLVHHFFLLPPSGNATIERVCVAAAIHDRKLGLGWLPRQEAVMPCWVCWVFFGMHPHSVLPW